MLGNRKKRSSANLNGMLETIPRKVKLRGRLFTSNVTFKYR